MELSRRSFLSAAAPLALAGCTVAQIQNFDQQWATASIWIAQQVQTAAHVLPTVESIAAVAAGLFGPQYQAIVVAGSAIANQVVQAILAALAAAQPPATPPASHRLGGKLASAVRTGPLPWAVNGVDVVYTK